MPMTMEELIRLKLKNSMALMKMSRIQTQNNHQDTHVVNVLKFGALRQRSNFTGEQLIAKWAQKNYLLHMLRNRTQNSHPITRAHNALKSRNPRQHLDVTRENVIAKWTPQYLHHRMRIRTLNQILKSVSYALDHAIVRVFARYQCE